MLSYRKIPSPSIVSTNLPLPSVCKPSSASFNVRNPNPNFYSPIACTAAPSSATVAKKRKRYRRSYPGEAKGIVEEMRFVAMRLRTPANANDDNGDGDGSATWQPSTEGFLKYLVGSDLVFRTLERIVDESSEVSCWASTIGDYDAGQYHNPIDALRTFDLSSHFG